MQKQKEQRRRKLLMGMPLNRLRSLPVGRAVKLRYLLMDTLPGRRRCPLMEMPVHRLLCLPVEMKIFRPAARECLPAVRRIFRPMEMCQGYRQARVRPAPRRAGRIIPGMALRSSMDRSSMDRSRAGTMDKFLREECLHMAGSLMEPIPICPLRSVTTAEPWRRLL